MKKGRLGLLSSGCDGILQMFSFPVFGRVRTDVRLPERLLCARLRELKKRIDALPIRPTLSLFPFSVLSSMQAPNTPEMEEVSDSMNFLCWTKAFPRRA